MFTLLLTLCSTLSLQADLALKTTEVPAGKILLADYNGNSSFGSLSLAKGDSRQQLLNHSLGGSNVLGLPLQTDKDSLLTLGSMLPFQGTLHSKAADGLDLLALTAGNSVPLQTDKDSLLTLGSMLPFQGTLQSRAADGLDLLGLTAGNSDSSLGSLSLAKGDSRQNLLNHSLGGSNVLGLPLLTDKDGLLTLGSMLPFQGTLHSRAADGLNLLALTAANGDSSLGNLSLAKGGLCSQFQPNGTLGALDRLGFPLRG